MRIVYVFTILFSVILMSSCSTVTNKVESNIDKKKVFVVLPFENNTETPLAGIRVSSIVEGVAVSKGFQVKNGSYTRESKEYSYADIESIMQQLTDKDIDYVITGSVNEFRYKTGIDGEPAVNIVIKIIDLKNSKTILVNTGSKTGWSHESLTTVTQKIVNRLLP